MTSHPEARPGARGGGLTSVLAELSLFAVLFVAVPTVFLVAAQVGFVVAAPGPLPDNLGVATLYDVLPRRWWPEPIWAALLIVNLPRVAATPWLASPYALFAAARRRDATGDGFLRTLAWSGGWLLVLLWMFLGLTVVVIVAAIVLIGLVAIFAYGRAASAGWPDPVTFLAAAAVVGLVFGAYGSSPGLGLTCRGSATPRLGSGEPAPCTEMVWFADREALPLRRADGSTLLVGIAGVDRAALDAALGSSAFFLDRLGPID